MKQQEKLLKDALNEKMVQFIDEMHETSEWQQTGVIIHDEASVNMTDAAWAVFEAMFKSQSFAIECGAVKEA